MKVVMYHYVRPPPKGMPYFRYLHIDDFRRQLDYFTQSGGFVSHEALTRILNGECESAEGYLLTFDDGLRDHLEFVVPELERRGVFGIFYVPTGQYGQDALLDVHRVHCLVGALGGIEMLGRLLALAEPDMISAEHRARFEPVTYRAQDDNTATAQFKRLLNYTILQEYRGPLLDRLVAGAFSEPLAPRAYYMAPSDLTELARRGMMVGSHTVTHPVLSTLARREQFAEAANSFAFLEQHVGPLAPRTFCHPYGGFHSFNRDTETVLAELKVAFSVNVESRDASPEDFRVRPHAIPRYDCNEFPYGMTRRDDQ